MVTRSRPPLPRPGRRSARGGRGPAAVGAGGARLRGTPEEGGSGPPPPPARCSTSAARSPNSPCSPSPTPGPAPPHSRPGLLLTLQCTHHRSVRSSAGRSRDLRSLAPSRPAPGPPRLYRAAAPIPPGHVRPRPPRPPAGQRRAPARRSESTPGVVPNSTGARQPLMGGGALGSHSPPSESRGGGGWGAPARAGRKDGGSSGGGPDTAFPPREETSSLGGQHEGNELLAPTNDNFNSCTTSWPNKLPRGHIPCPPSWQHKHPLPRLPAVLVLASFTSPK